MQSYFEVYARALLARDLEQIERHFAYPCMIVNQAGVDVIHDADELHQHLEGFLAMLMQRGVTSIDVDVRAESQSGADHATAAVAYTLKDTAGQAVETFAFLYVLVKGRAGAWQIRLAELLSP